jgi:hypothetical protein
MELSERKAILEDLISEKLTDQNWSVVYKSDTKAVLLFKRKVNHVLHAVLSLITGGIWLIPWLLMILTNRGKSSTWEVDESGNVDWQ